MCSGRGLPRKGLLGRGLLGAPKVVRSECCPECEPPRVNVVHGRLVSKGVWDDTIPHRFYTRVWSGI